MKRLLILTCLFTACTAAVVGQTSLLADGNPPLTQAVVDRVESVFERLLDIRLTATQHTRLRQGLIAYWTEKNQNGMRTTLTNARYYDSPAEIAELRSSGQTAIIEGLRRDAAETNDPVSTVLVEAFDQAHPNMRASTRARTFADLVGTWKKQDSLLADRNPYSGSPQGVSYTDSHSVQIDADGKFAVVKVHNHCNGGCCRLDGEEDFETVNLGSGNLNFQTTKGSKLIDDGCLGKKQRTEVVTHRDSFSWSIRKNPNTGALSLCLTSADGKSECFDKQ